MNIKKIMASFSVVSLITACLPVISVYANESSMRDITTMDLFKIWESV